MNRKQTLISKGFMLILAGCLIALAGELAAEEGKKPTAPQVLQRENLVAWCIVPFDSKNRSPAERIAMLKKLGFRRFAYDWRDNHVSSFEQEIRQCKEHGIEYTAFWGVHDKAFELFEKYDLHPQIWIMLPSPKGPSESEKVNQAVKEILPIVERTKKMKCKLGIYNHGGWGGEPGNMVAVCKQLHEKYQANHVGIVYNLHHGHEHIPNFTKHLEEMKPYLLCLNLNGMNDKDPKILHLGAGKHDLSLFKKILASGYKGAIGIIGHTNDDVELRLKDNLDGLDWLISQINGQPSTDRPTYRTP